MAERYTRTVQNRMGQPLEVQILSCPPRRNLIFFRNFLMGFLNGSPSKIGKKDSAGQNNLLGIWIRPASTDFSPKKIRKIRKIFGFARDPTPKQAWCGTGSGSGRGALVRITTQSERTMQFQATARSARAKSGVLLEMGSNFFKQTSQGTIGQLVEDVLIRSRFLRRSQVSMGD